MILQSYRAQYVHPSPEKFGHLSEFAALTMLMLPFFDKACRKAGYARSSIQEIRFAKQFPALASSTSKDPIAQEHVLCEVQNVIEADKDFRASQMNQESDRNTMQNQLDEYAANLSSYETTSDEDMSMSGTDEEH